MKPCQVLDAFPVLVSLIFTGVVAGDLLTKWKIWISNTSIQPEGAGGVVFGVPIPKTKAKPEEP